MTTKTIIVTAALLLGTVPAAFAQSTYTSGAGEENQQVAQSTYTTGAGEAQVAQSTYTTGAGEANG